MPFYLLAKIHKQPVKGRPIIPTQNWVTYNLSKWLAEELNSHVVTSPYILRDSLDLIQSLELDESLKKELKGQPEVWLLSADVEALYPNINTARGVHMITKLLKRKDHGTPARREFISKALNLVLRQGYVTFQGEVYQQINGTAMGTCVGPQYANLFMEELERDLVEEWRHKGLKFYKRFIDDIFAIFVGPKALAEQFDLEINALDPSIKLNTVISDKNSDFLDVTVYIDHMLHSHGLLRTRVYQKPLNQYLYLPYTSYHTHKQRTGFIKGECIRYIRNSSKQEDYDALVKLFRQRLLKRGYPLGEINKGISQVHHKDRCLYLKVKPKDKSVVPFLFKVEQNPRLNPRAIRNELDLLQKDLETIPNLPKSLQGHITICYKLSPRLHGLVLKARHDKGF